MDIQGIQAIQSAYITSLREHESNGTFTLFNLATDYMLIKNQGLRVYNCKHGGLLRTHLNILTMIEHLMQSGYYPERN